MRFALLAALAIITPPEEGRGYALVGPRRSASYVITLVLAGLVAILLAACAGAPAAPPPDAIQADLDFPPGRTTWVRRSLGYFGEHITRSTVLEEGVHRTRPV